MTSLASNPQDKHSPNKPIEAHTNPYEDVLFNEHIWTEKDIGSNAISVSTIKLLSITIGLYSSLNPSSSQQTNVKLGVEPYHNNKRTIDK